MNPAIPYWESRFSEKEAIKHHAGQNRVIARDFLGLARIRKPFALALCSERIIEIGCGTGELSAQVKQRYNTPVFYGTDFSRSAIKVAQKKHPSVNYWVYDILNDHPFASFDLLISSNVIEHFKTPHTVINKMFHLAPLLLLLVPYRQPVTDGYDAEGSAGHVFEFNEHEFSSYILHDWFTFQTRGWEFSSAGEEPKQLAVLISSE